MSVKITSGCGLSNAIFYMAEPVPSHTNVFYMAVAIPDHLIMVVIRKKTAAIYVSETVLPREFFDEMLQSKVFHSVERAIENIVANTPIEVKFRSTQLAIKYLEIKLPSNVMYEVINFLPKIEEAE